MHFMMLLLHRDYSSRIQVAAASGIMPVCCGRKQFYHYVLQRLADGDPAARAAAESRTGRNHDWVHLYNGDVSRCRINGNIPGTLRGTWRSTACR